MSDIQENGQPSKPLVPQKANLNTVSVPHYCQTGNETRIYKIAACNRRAYVKQYLILHQRQWLQLRQEAFVFLGGQCLQDVIYFRPGQPRIAFCGFGDHHSWTGERFAPNILAQLHVAALKSVRWRTQSPSVPTTTLENG